VTSTIYRQGSQAVCLQRISQRLPVFAKAMFSVDEQSASKDV